ncbi:unnamed protein product [Prunus armeniaca]|uniref:Retrotransposon gag domain-containing protein n=1 Tax=Prunus armeniaca TaxID=36596 RepID=A0A6J5UPM6_PRUAR|nr:unnamed protein product [Prunus armeniaca]CAB4308907.1 unnamed protein product [Prunus armeniaca]
MSVKDVGDAMKCGAFPLLLERSAKDWFKSLKRNSISSFYLLKQSFVNQFLSTSKKRYPPHYLLSISCSKDTTYTALLAGFRRGPFIFHVNKLPPKSYEDLVSEAYCHAIVEEMTYDTLEGKDPSQPSVGKAEIGHKILNKFRSRFDNYTPLNTNRQEVFFHIQTKLPRPRPLRFSKGRKDPNPYCRYHHENGHTTDQCYELQDEIEAIIRRGRLSQFVGEKKQAEQHDNIPDKPPRVTKDINVISGGETLAGHSNKARKVYA